MPSLLSLLLLLPFLILLLLQLPSTFANPSPPRDTNYAFSLSTFNPKGSLLQLEYAHKATSLNLGSFAISTPSKKRITMFSPHVQTSPFAITITKNTIPNFAQLTHNIIISTTGSFNPDAQLLQRHLQDFVLESDDGCVYPTYSEVLIEVTRFLQGYTVKPGVRPLAVCLLIGVYDQGQGMGRVFNVDCCGNVREVVEGFDSIGFTENYSDAGGDSETEDGDEAMCGYAKGIIKKSVKALNDKHKSRLRCKTFGVCTIDGEGIRVWNDLM